MRQVEADMSEGRKVVHKILGVHMIVGVEAGTKAVGIGHMQDQVLEVEGLVAGNLRLEGSQLDREEDKAAGLDLEADKAMVAVHTE